MQQQEKHSQSMVLGLQHLLAMYSGSILVPMMIGKALGYNTEQLTYLVSLQLPLFYSSISLQKGS